MRMDDPPDEPPFFEVSDLRQSFGAEEVLRGVSFFAPRGRTTVILGGSGAGKSVLLKHLNGLLRPRSGEVRVLGREIGPLSERELAPLRRRIGVLFQDGALLDSLDVGENVAFPLREQGGGEEAEISSRVAEVLEMVGLSGQERKMPDALSGGMRKRVSLARALAARPDCLLCDEPTAGLDPILAESITKLLRRLQSELRLTSVIVTHNLGAMRYAADRVVFLKDGAVRYAGTVGGFESCPDTAVREFIEADAIGRG